MDPEQLKKLQEKEEALGGKIQKLLKKIGGKKPTKAQSDKLAALQGRLDRVGDTKQKALTAVIAADEDEDPAEEIDKVIAGENAGLPDDYDFFSKRCEGEGSPTAC